MSGQYQNGERRDCLDCHGTLEYDGEDESWSHVEENSCPRER